MKSILHTPCKRIFFIIAVISIIVIIIIICFNVDDIFVTRHLDIRSDMPNIPKIGESIRKLKTNGELLCLKERIHAQVYIIYGSTNYDYFIEFCKSHHFQIESHSVDSQDYSLYAKHMGLSRDKLIFSSKTTSFAYGRISRDMVSISFRKEDNTFLMKIILP